MTTMASEREALQGLMDALYRVQHRMPDAVQAAYEVAHRTLERLRTRKPEPERDWLTPAEEAQRHEYERGRADAHCLDGPRETSGGSEWTFQRWHDAREAQVSALRDAARLAVTELEAVQKHDGHAPSTDHVLEALRQAIDARPGDEA